MFCMWIKDGFHFKFKSGHFSGLPTELPTISYLEVEGCPLYPYMDVMGSLICMAKFPWAAHSAADFFIFGSSEATELPTVSIYGSSGQPNLHGEIPMTSPRAAHSVAHVQPMGSEVGSSPVFPYGMFVWIVFCSSIMNIRDNSALSSRLMRFYGTVRPSGFFLSVIWPFIPIYNIENQSSIDEFMY